MPEAAVDEELQAHFHAYLQIFRSVLNKRGIDPSRQKEILQKLRQFLLANVKSDDEFLDHIPEYASALGVKAEQLSAFIGQNLLKALESVRHQLEQQKVTAAREAVSRAETTGPPADDKAAQSIIEEILRATGVVVPAPAHFENHDLGFMKYIDENGGEHISGAFGEQSGGAPIATPAKTAPSAGNGKTVTGQSVPGGGGVDKAAAKTSAPVVTAKERPVIEEILEVLGDDHEIPGKLEPAEFPPEMSAAAAAAAPAPGNAPGGATTAASGTSSAAPSSGNAASAAPRPAAAPIVFPDEKEHLIAEIITKFGDSLSIPGKLEPDDGMGDSSGEYAPAPGSQSASMGGAGAGNSGGVVAPPKVEVPPIPYHF
ncbi:MAG: hypothetical protein KDK34_04165, partial [Leptospiraceae bacterium]|nr:hypothetical protein [Leptospiraceae bacterium]